MSSYKVNSDPNLLEFTKQLYELDMALKKLTSEDYPEKKNLKRDKISDYGFYPFVFTAFASDEVSRGCNSTVKTGKSDSITGCGISCICCMPCTFVLDVICCLPFASVCLSKKCRSCVSNKSKEKVVIMTQPTTQIVLHEIIVKPQEKL